MGTSPVRWTKQKCHRHTRKLLPLCAPFKGPTLPRCQPSIPAPCTCITCSVNIKLVTWCFVLWPGGLTCGAQTNRRSSGCQPRPNPPFFFPPSTTGGRGSSSVMMRGAALVAVLALSTLVPTAWAQCGAWTGARTATARNPNPTNLVLSPSVCTSSWPPQPLLCAQDLAVATAQLSRRLPHPR